MTGLSDPIPAPYGSWRSPITAALIAEGAVPLGQVELDGQDLYWLEGRPSEGGRYVIVRRDPTGGEPRAITPEGFNVRTRVHEYGGGAYRVRDGTVYFSNDADGRLYRQAGVAAPVPITPDPPAPATLRYADACLTPDGAWLICVRESHHDGSEPTNDMVALPTDGSAEPRLIASGNDFYAAPRISPDGRQLAWLTWHHPNMPWDGCELWLGDLAANATLTNARHVAGGSAESLFQPEWSDDGVLYVVSDRTGWWNLYRVESSGLEPLAPMAAEFGTPQWVFGLATYAFAGDGRIVCAYSQDGVGYLGLIGPDGGGIEALELADTSFGFVRSNGRGFVAYLGASASEPAAVRVLDLATGTAESVRRSVESTLAPGYVSTPESVRFTSAEGREAHALFYRPRNDDFVAEGGELPPLLVLSHGGPTSATSPALNLSIQFWTSRGFAVVDVNYGGSSGYGRHYRQRLNGQWGIVDVEDCTAAARFLALRGLVDGRRVAMRGGSAGGFTTLAALTFTSGTFAAGASYYGVADLETLAQDTHKFESRYLDTLVGPYPAERATYLARSPLHHADRLDCPVILCQGLEDRVVPPAQAEAMVAALRARGVPHAYLAFPGEQHGFRRAETLVRAVEAELYFYGQVLGFTPADPIAPVVIENELEKWLARPRAPAT